MFDSRKIGKKIAELRKAKDLTQLELADRMVVSYQAVSNWERGNSMPDISNLVELAKILEVSIEELLDSEKETRIVKKVIDQPEQVNLEEAAKVAVLIKPVQLEKIIENQSDSEVNGVTLLNLAPYISSERLMELIERGKFTDLETIANLAPFLESEHLVSLILKQNDLIGSLQGLSRLAPFLESQDLVNVIHRNPRLIQEPKALAGLAPFLEQTDLENILESLPEEERISELIVGLAPFMSGKYLAKIGRHALEAGKMTIFRALLPFIDESEL